MHKFSFALLMAAACFAFAAVASSQDQSAEPAKPAPATVSAAQQMPDDADVVLQGTIVSTDGENMYVLTDDTGSINVEIDAEDIAGLNIGPNDIVIIQGEVDRNGDITEIDVEDISLAQ